MHAIILVWRSQPLAKNVQPLAKNVFREGLATPDSP